jgi:DNA-binding NarL/FixJ family response regulator
MFGLCVKRIILVDDDYGTEALVEGLQFRGYDATRIASFSEANSSLDTLSKSDLVVLDIIMERPPDNLSKISGNRTSGMHLLRALREKAPTLPILVFSATTDTTVIDSIKQIPHASFYSKWNATVASFIATIGRIVGDASGTRKLKSFIVHGHDDVAKLALKNYLQNKLSFSEPIILHEKPSLGRTIIEKLEDYALDVDLVFVLLTPDDTMSSPTDSNETKRRARQNVIFELGFFLGIYGRLSGRVFLLHKGPLDLASDLSGVIYIDITNGIEAAGEQIRTEVQNALF